MYWFCGYYCYYNNYVGEHDQGHLRFVKALVTYFPPLDILRSTMMVTGEQSVALDLEQKSM